MSAKRVTSSLLALLAIAFWLSVGFYFGTGAIVIGSEAAGLDSRWAPLGGLSITLAGIFLSIWALRRWSK
ncbi:Putative membrane protein [Sphingopyxis fribergensis]|uniref:Putative membrane protein n=1 Tax=Sphingopyxis fribergensis TaxID=1515612 RepID=A0A0A7PLC2_9SPHN|nr:hypothetical protein [Sphingopyxis fribergensis]AJA08697.1 Putative membrane protein [Sphingopyxis fribergensis]